VVSHLQEIVEAEVNFGLATSSHFVMLAFDIETAIDHRLHHLIADVHHLVRGRDREITFLVPQFVTQVGTFLLAPIPLAFDAIDVVVTLVGLLVEADVVEDEEFRFRSEVRGVGNPCTLQVVLRFACYVARIARVIFARDRILNVADHAECWQRGERIDEGGFCLRYDEHVAFVNRLPTTNAGTVKAEPVFKDFFG
jgi:hypothetical protein